MADERRAAKWTVAYYQRYHITVQPLRPDEPPYRDMEGGVVTFCLCIPVEIPENGLGGFFGEASCA